MRILTNCEYNKVKVLQQLCALDWFIQKHYLEDAKKVNDLRSHDLMVKLCDDLEKYITTLHEMVGKNGTK